MRMSLTTAAIITPVHYQPTPPFRLAGTWIEGRVKASHDAFFVLRVSEDEVYEIGIGCWNNSKTVVRRGVQDGGEPLAQSLSLLLWEGWNDFRVEWTSGTLEIRFNGLHWVLDGVKVSGVREVSVSTGWGSGGQWELGYLEEKPAEEEKKPAKKVEKKEPAKPVEKKAPVEEKKEPAKPVEKKAPVEEKKVEPAKAPEKKVEEKKEPAKPVEKKAPVEEKKVDEKKEPAKTEKPAQPIEVEKKAEPVKAPEKKEEKKQEATETVEAKKEAAKKVTITV